MSIVGFTKGKALIVLTRSGKAHPEDRRHMMPRVDVFVQTGGHDYVHEDLDTWFSLYGDQWFLKKTPVDGKVRLWIQYEITYSRDYFGEHDFDVEFRHRVLRRQNPPKELYRSKK